MVRVQGAGTKEERSKEAKKPECQEGTNTSYTDYVQAAMWGFRNPSPMCVEG